MKKLAIVLSVILMVSLLALPAQAAAVEPASTQATYIDNIRCSIDADTTLGLFICTGELTATGFYEAELVLTLQTYYNGAWRDVYSWQAEDYIYVEISETYFYGTGTLYRVQAVGTVYSDTGAVLETASVVDLLPRGTLDG